MSASLEFAKCHATVPREPHPGISAPREVPGAPPRSSRRRSRLFLLGSRRHRPADQLALPTHSSPRRAYMDFARRRDSPKSPPSGLPREAAPERKGGLAHASLPSVGCSPHRTPWGICAESASAVLARIARRDTGLAGG